MVTEILNRRVSATDVFSAPRRSATVAKTFLSKDLWVAIWFAAMAVAISLGLAYATVGTGIDLTIGAAPIDMTLSAAPVGH